MKANLKRESRAKLKKQTKVRALTENEQSHFEKKDTYSEDVKRSWKNKVRALMEYDLRRTQAELKKKKKKLGPYFPWSLNLFMCATTRQDDDEPTPTETR